MEADEEITFKVQKFVHPPYGNKAAVIIRYNHPGQHILACHCAHWIQAPGATHQKVRAQIIFLSSFSNTGGSFDTNYILLSKTLFMYSLCAFIGSWVLFNASSKAEILPSSPRWFPNKRPKPPPLSADWTQNPPKDWIWETLYLCPLTFMLAHPASTAVFWTVCIKAGLRVMARLQKKLTKDISAHSYKK